MAKNDKQKDKNHPLKQEGGINRSVVGRKQFVRRAFLDRALSGNPTAEQLEKHKAELKEKRANEKANEKWRELVALQAKQFGMTGVEAFVQKQPLFRHELPLYTIVKEESPGTFKAYVTPGKIVDILTKTGNNYTVIDIDKGAGELKYGVWRYPISENDWVYLDYETKETGDVGMEAGKVPKLVVGSSVPDSLQFKPPVGTDDEGEKGHMYVKVAQFKIENGAIKVYHHAGGNDYIHDRNRSPMEMVGTGVDIFKQYNLDTGYYEYRALHGVSPISVEADGDTIDILLEGGADLDWTIKYWTLKENSSTENVPIEITLPSGFETEDAGSHGHSIQTGTGTTYGALTADGAHVHSVPVGDGGGGTGIEIAVTLAGNIPATGTDGDHYHTYYDWFDGVEGTETRTTGGVDPPGTDGDHFHSISGTYSGTFDLSAHNHALTWAPGGDGAHQHAGKTDTVSDHKHAISGTVNATADIPMKSYSIEVVEDKQDILCWRNGLFVGIYGEEGDLPDLTGGDVPSYDITTYSWAGPPASP
jgi:hypothetical protein